MTAIWTRRSGRAACSGTRGSQNEVRLPGPFRVRKGVIGTRVLGCIVLMNPVKEEYLTLNGVAASIWELVDEGLTSVKIAERLCREYDAPEDRIAADVATQLRSWLQQHLIEPASPTSKAEPCRFEPVSTVAGEASAEISPRLAVAPGVLQCGFMILAIKAMLKIRGFAWTVDWIRGRVEKIPASTLTTVDTVRAIQWPVAMAAALYPGRARCLEQSLVLYYLLRRRGTSVRYCQGVKPFPFQAHAWIEYRGEPINDVSEHAQQFVRLPDQLP